MTGMTDRKTKASASSILGLRAFAAISAVDGRKLTAAGNRRLAEMDAKGLSPAERRAEIFRAYRSKGK